jgi:hypothetical protein
MTKKVILVLLTVLFIAGCGISPDKISMDSFEVNDNIENSASKVVSLADVDLNIVPEKRYYILMEESLGKRNRSLVRRYVTYDGFKDVISEQTSEIDLPRSFQRTIDAKEYLAENAPDKLNLYPSTYLNESVLAQWEQEEYDYSYEAKNIISLDMLKQLGAISRTSEVFVITPKPEIVTEKIEALEKEFLRYHPNLEMKREIEALSHSLTYRIDLSLHEKPILERSAVVTNATLYLFYSVDELGNPLKLTLKATFETRDRKISPLLKPVISDMAVFTLIMRETLVENLNLSGVNNNNPSLSYANVTLNFEGEESDLRYMEHYYIK